MRLSTVLVSLVSLGVASSIVSAADCSDAAIKNCTSTYEGLQKKCDSDDHCKCEEGKKILDCYIGCDDLMKKIDYESKKTEVDAICELAKKVAVTSSTSKTESKTSEPKSEATASSDAKSSKTEESSSKSATDSKSGSESASSTSSSDHAKATGNSTHNSTKDDDDKKNAASYTYPGFLLAGLMVVASALAL